ncbi:hypothetical protein V494_00180 [Pseudogymnoascus sp. VKM F-4513 (FW-928)]|nr:hypothetical protein V494_00180 [Pseudogymnoascus sp. VKM F-4513 (FW-928)]
MKLIQLSIDHTVALLSLLGLACSAAVPGDAQSRDVAATASSSGTYCCKALQLAMGSKVSLPNTTPYRDSTGSFYSLQNTAITPSCVVSATSTADVQKAVGILSSLSVVGQVVGSGCKFAIRSGGHTPWGGAATIQNGVDIDLSALNHVTVSSDKKSVSIGPGNRWIDVYMKLDALGLGVSGGRVASVGVGGLITGGGMSFFSARHGFVCDTVTEFEVVLAFGQVVVANAKINPTLFSALKGGSNNLGVVTRINLEVFPQGKFWGGSVVYPSSTIPQQLAAFVDFTGQNSFDIYGALINSYAYNAAAGDWIVANNYDYTKAEAYPAAFAKYTSIKPELVNTMRISNMSDFATELEGTNAYGKAQIFYTATYVNDLPTLTNLFNQANSSLQSVIGVDGLSWSLSLQPLPTQITKFGDATGGNSLGLHASSGNLVLALLTASWSNAADEAVVAAALTDMYTKANAFAKSKGTLNAFQYLNYAYKTQSPITGYGADNVRKLKAASKKFDPFKIFQNFVPGGFKL